MGITLAGGAEFPHFDRLVILGQWIVILGFLIHLGTGIARLFRGSAPEILPAIAKAALGFAALAALPAIGEGAFRAGGGLADAIAGEQQVDALMLAIGGALMSVVDEQGAFDVLSIDFWLSMAAVLCTSFAYISKYIILEVLWPLYLGLVVVGGSISIPLGTIPGMKTAQAWVLTLLEAISWPVIFQVLLGVIAAVSTQQVRELANTQGDFIPMLEGLATLCAVSLLTIMTPLIAARMMRGEGASAAMSFIAGKAAFMVSGMASRAAVGAVTGPAKLGMRAARMGAGPLAAGAGGSSGGDFGGPGPMPPSSQGGQAAGARPARRPLRRTAPAGAQPVSARRPAAAAPDPRAAQPAPTGVPSSTQSVQPAPTAHTHAHIDSPQPTPRTSSAQERSESNRAHSALAPSQRHGLAQQDADRTASPRGHHDESQSAGAPPSTKGSALRAQEDSAPASSNDGSPASHDAAPPRATLDTNPARPARLSDGPAASGHLRLVEPPAEQPGPTAHGTQARAPQSAHANPAQPGGPRPNLGSSPRAASTQRRPDARPGHAVHAANAATGRPAAGTRHAHPDTAGPQRPVASPRGAAPAVESPRNPTAQRPTAQARPQLDWGAPERARAGAQATPQSATARRFYNIKGSTKAATAALIAANKAGNPQRAQQIRDIVKAHPPTGDNAGKAERRELIRRAIARLDEEPSDG